MGASGRPLNFTVRSMAYCRQCAVELPEGRHLCDSCVSVELEARQEAERRRNIRNERWFDLVIPSLIGMVLTWPAWEIYLGGDAGLPKHYDRTRLFVCIVVFHTAVYLLMQTLVRGWST